MKTSNEQPTKQQNHRSHNEEWLEENITTISLSNTMYLFLPCIYWLLLACHRPAPNESSLSNWQLRTESYGLISTYPIHRNHVVGSGYGMRTHPVTGKQKMHYGQDFPCRKGEPIRAIATGEVTISTHSETAGNWIEIKHVGEPQIHTRYLHLHRRYVGVGETVVRGQRIGNCGNTGRSTGPHLHFEIRINNKPIPPLELKNTWEQERGEWDVLYGF